MGAIVTLQWLSKIAVAEGAAAAPSAVTLPADREEE